MRYAALCAATTLLPFAAQADTLTYSSLYVFGDSFSDGGNVFAVTGGTNPDPNVYFYSDNPEVPTGQFTNGDTWATQLGLTPSLLGGTNYAFGGAEAAFGIGSTDATPEGEAPDLADQIGMLSMTSPTIAQDALAVIWLGGNDFLNAGSEENIPLAVGDAVNSIGEGILQLDGLGFENFVVVNSPNLCYGPFYANPVKNCDPTLPLEAAEAGDPTIDPVTLATLGFNLGLLEMIAGLEELDLALGLDLNIEIFDVFTIVEGLVNFGPFADTETACVLFAECFTGDAALQSSYVFWDTVHPTEGVHTLIANEFATRYTPVPLPASALLFLTAIGGFAAVRRQQARRN